MRSSAGRIIFFDLLANQYRSAFFPKMPRQLALYQSAKSAAISSPDLYSLAQALCRLHLADAIEIKNIRWSEIPFTSIPTAGIFDAEGRTLRECVKLMDQKLLPNILVIVNSKDDDAKCEKLIYEPVKQRGIIASAIDGLFKMCGLESDVLARVRYEARGFDALAQDFNLFEQSGELDWSDPAVLDLFYYRLSEGWSYAGQPVMVETISAWVKQFGAASLDYEAHLILMYLQQSGFVTETQVVHGLLHQYHKIAGGLGPRNIAMSIQRPGKSELKLAYRLKPAIQLATSGEAINRAVRLSKSGKVALFCFDDCLMSGESFSKYLFNVAHNAKATELSSLLASGAALLNVITFHADLRGIEYLEKLPQAHGALKVYAERILDDSHRAFSESSRIVTDPVRRAALKSFCHNIGQQLFPGGPLGWDDGQLCITYDYSIPDNSLPVLSESGSGAHPWLPLFKRQR